MRLIHALLMALSMATSAVAAEKVEPDSHQVILFGLFHFDNPGLDAVKFDTIDVMTPASQRYLNELAQRLAAFKPTQVLLEYNPTRETEINQKYQDYLAGKFELQRNEIYQIGFRVAKLAGLASVMSFDERNTPSQGDLWNYMPKNAPDKMAQVETLIAELSTRFQREHQTMSLQQLLKQHNSLEFDRENKSFYLLTNSVGADNKSFHGADASAVWWQRNFRMFATIQWQATQHKRILVIAGQGHTAILRDLLRLDPALKEQDINRYL